MSAEARVRKISSSTSHRADAILALLRRRSSIPPKPDTVEEEKEEDKIPKDPQKK